MSEFTQFYVSATDKDGVVTKFMVGDRFISVLSGSHPVQVRIDEAKEALFRQIGEDLNLERHG